LTLGWDPIDESRVRIWEINADFRTEDEEYNALAEDDTEGREAYLLANEPYAVARRLRDAYKIDFPDHLVNTYVDYYVNPDNKRPKDLDKNIPWFEDDWYIIEHPEFWLALKKTMRETDPDWGKKKDEGLIKVPTRNVYKKYIIYQDKVSGKPRMDYRWDNPDLDAWGVLRFGWTPIVEQRRRESLSPTERFLEDLAKKQKQARATLDKLLTGR